MQSGAVARAPRSGGGPTTVVLAAANVPGGLVGVNAANLYFGGSRFESIPIGGTTAQTIATTSFRVDAIAFDGQSVWYADSSAGIGDAVFRDGTFFMRTAFVSQMNAYNGCVYFDGCGSIAFGGSTCSSCGDYFPTDTPIFAGSACGLVTADSAGIHLWKSFSVLFGPGLSHVVRVVADTDSAYWTDATGAIGKLPLP
jgi:hypothetical protein